jgi:hypothetical protein
MPRSSARETSLVSVLGVAAIAGLLVLQEEPSGRGLEILTIGPGVSELGAPPWCDCTRWLVRPPPTIRLAGIPSVSSARAADRPRSRRQWMFNDDTVVLGCVRGKSESPRLKLRMES